MKETRAVAPKSGAFSPMADTTTRQTGAVNVGTEPPEGPSKVPETGVIKEEHKEVEKVVRSSESSATHAKAAGRGAAAGTQVHIASR